VTELNGLGRELVCGARVAGVWTPLSVGAEVRRFPRGTRVTSGLMPGQVGLTVDPLI
jgi:hypothetical protein